MGILIKPIGKTPERTDLIFIFPSLHDIVSVMLHVTQ